MSAMRLGGKVALVAGLSGTSGQVSDPYGSRPVVQAADPRSDIAVRGLLSTAPLDPVRSISASSRRRARRAAASASLAASGGDASVTA